MTLNVYNHFILLKLYRCVQPTFPFYNLSLEKLISLQNCRDHLESNSFSKIHLYPKHTSGLQKLYGSVAQYE